MPRLRCAFLVICELVFFACFAVGQAVPVPITLTVVDENGAPVPDVTITIGQPNASAVRLTTDYAGRASYVLHTPAPYSIRVQKPGFYETTVTDQDPQLRSVRIVLAHEQMIVQQVSVAASLPGIDPEQVSDKMTMNVPEIVNIPYPTSRDIRNLLPFYPGVIQDASGQIHVAGSETWATLDLLDNFDIRSPISGQLAMRVSADAVRSIDQQTTRYPVQYGRATGGVVAFYTGMGDNKFRFNATNFIPSFRDINGIRFDKYVPRVTWSGPLVRDRAWFFDGLELEYDNIYIKELPANANTNTLIRGSNLFRTQVNVKPRNILSAGLLYNNSHSPYQGLSPLVPRQSTVNNNILALMPYVRDQHNFGNGALFDIGFDVARFRNGYEPHPGDPFQLTPELSLGSYFENLTSHSQRVESNAILYLPARTAMGRHDMQAGVDLDHIGFSESITRAPVQYLRENRTLLRESTFPATSPFTRHNVELGAYLQDRWTARGGLLLEPGLRFDWDEIIRRPLLSPRFAAIYTAGSFTKISAGAGLYYEHTQLEYLTRALAGMRIDTLYGADGVTPAGPPVETTFVFNPGSLHEARALNWSIGLEQRLPAAIYIKANYIGKRVNHEFTYAPRFSVTDVYTLTNDRTDHDNLVEIEARRTFSGSYTLFGAYTHSSAHTNAAIDYVPTVSELAPQQPGPLPWDTPNRFLSWGWLPFAVPYFKRDWDFVYTLDWHTGFPYTAINANHFVVGAPGAFRFPNYMNFSPGLEWRFHFRGMYLGLRGVLENATNHADPLVVNNVVDSPQFGVFTEPYGRAFTARIRLIESKR